MLNKATRVFKCLINKKNYAKSKKNSSINLFFFVVTQENI